MSTLDDARDGQPVTLPRGREAARASSSVSSEGGWPARPQADVRRTPTAALDPPTFGPLVFYCRNRNLEWPEAFCDACGQHLPLPGRTPVA